MRNQDKYIKINSAQIVESIVKDTLFPIDVNQFESESDKGSFPCEETGENFLRACKGRNVGHQP